MPERAMDKWAQDKDPILAMFYQSHAGFAEILFEILSYTKKQEPIPGFKEILPKEWLKLYRTHRHLESHLRKSFREAGGLAERLISFFLSFLTLIRTSPDKRAPSLYQDLQATGEALLREMNKLGPTGVASYFENPPIDEESESKIREYFLAPEFLFFFKITIPCFFLYKTIPTHLLRQARLGNLKALEQLIRLDKAVLADPLIMTQTLRLQQRDKYKYDSTVVRAMAGAPKFELSPKLPKYLLSGIISLFSEALGSKLNEPEIRSLFNAIAHDNSDGATAIDPDLPDSPESFSKAIQRDRAFWKSIFFPDTTF